MHISSSGENGPGAANPTSNSGLHIYILVRYGVRQRKGAFSLAIQKAMMRIMEPGYTKILCDEGMVRLSEKPMELELTSIVHKTQ